MTAIHRPGTIYTLLPKVGSEKSQLLTKDKYLDLANSKTLKEFISKLQSTPYGQLHIQENFSLELLTFFFKEALFRVISKLINNSPKNYRIFFQAYLVKYEMENIKTLLRGFHTNVNREELSKNLHYSVEALLGRERLIRECLEELDLHSLVQTLSKLPYGKVIRESFLFFEREQFSFFHFDVFLDLKYFQGLWNAHQKLDRKNRGIVRKFIGLELDCYNLETILRAKNLKLASSEIYQMITRQFYRLKQEFLDHLINDEILSEELFGKLGIRDKREYNLRDPQSIRHLLKRETLKLIHNFYCKAGFNIGKPFALLKHKEIEIENLRRISIGIHYRKLPDEIMNRLYIVENI